MLLSLSPALLSTPHAIYFSTKLSVSSKVSASDVVYVDDLELSAHSHYERPKLWMIHKLRGELSNTTDENGKNRPVVFDRLRQVISEEGMLMAVNKLEFNTEGLMLLTNNSKLARVMSRVDTGRGRGRGAATSAAAAAAAADGDGDGLGLESKYRLRVHGKITPSKLDGLLRGLTINGVK